MKKAKSIVKMQYILHSEMGYDNIHDFYHNIGIELGMTESEIIEIEGDDMVYDLIIKGNESHEIISCNTE